MNDPSLGAVPVVDRRSAVREYGPPAALVVASLLLQRALASGVVTVDRATPDLIDPRLVGAVVYAGLALAALAAVYVAQRVHRRPADPLEGHELLALGGVTTLVALLAAYLAHDAADLPVFPGSVVTALLDGALATGGLGIAYASARGIDVRAGVSESAVRWSGVAAGATALACAGWIAAALVVGEFVGVAGGAFLGRRLTPGWLVFESALPALLVGVGTALLYNGVIQEEVRGRAGPAPTVAAVTVLAGAAATWLGVGRATGPAALVTTAVVAAVGVLAALLAAGAVDRLWGDASIVRAAAVGAAVVAAPVVAMGAASGSATALLPAIGAAAPAIAAVAYERARSLWAPAAAHVVSLTLVDGDLVLFLASIVR